MSCMSIFEFDHLCDKMLPMSHMPIAIEMMPRFAYHCGPGIKRSRDRAGIVRIHDFAKQVGHD